MRKRSGVFAFMELLALISALCIVGIVIFAHYDRQAKARDELAGELAGRLGPAVSAFFQAQPEGVLTSQVISTLPGITVTEPLQLEVPRGAERASGWQVLVWHPEGSKTFKVSASGVEQDFR